jgi:hypothetical protein
MMTKQLTYDALEPTIGFTIGSTEKIATQHECISQMTAREHIVRDNTPPEVKAETATSQRLKNVKNV